MRSLELFSGTGSISKILRERGWECLTLDADPKARPDILTDIREWDYTAFPRNYFDFVWASPVCTMYSIARTRSKTPRDLEWADSLVQAALRIIEYFQPRLGWVLENPATGFLRTRPFMQSVPWLCDQCYCLWNEPGQATHPYMKQTRFWGRLPRELPSRICDKTCPFADGKRHYMTAQLGTNRKCTQDQPFSREQLYALPRLLCEAFAGCISDIGTN
jgi:hypothetical protein